MADEQAKDILRTALAGFDTPHLGKIVVAAFDRWNWDTGSDTDKDWFEIAEEILKERGVHLNMSNPTAINFTDGNGVTIPILSMDNNMQDLILGTCKTVQVTDASNPSAVKHDLFEVSQSNTLQLGWELKQAIINFLQQEMNGGTMSGSSGQNLQTIFEDKITSTIRNRI